MSAFFVFDNIETINQAAIDEYIAKAPTTVEKFGGMYRAIYGKTLGMEGDYKPHLPIIIEFPSFEKAKAWYDSDMYSDLKKLRVGAQVGTGYLIEGLPTMPWFIKIAFKLGLLKRK